MRGFYHLRLQVQLSHLQRAQASARGARRRRLVQPPYCQRRRSTHHVGRYMDQRAAQERRRPRFQRVAVACASVGTCLAYVADYFGQGVLSSLRLVSALCAACPCRG